VELIDPISRETIQNMKTLLTLVGIILLLAGLVFMGQGSRFFPYPAESFMVGASQWIYYGGGIAAIGVVALLIAWRL
jgi:MFS superfamily sulfate permease-like transporter